MNDIILSVRNLSVVLRADKSKILDNVSFHLSSGDVMAIDGLNGCGKSTLLRVIMGQTDDYIIESGSVIYHPYKEKSIFDFTANEMLEYHRMVGYVRQRDDYEGLNKITVEDLIDDQLSECSIPKEKAVELFDRYFSGNKKIKLRSVPGKLSGGEQRMISIFIGLVCRENAKLMIIDEPLNNLDFENVMRVSDLLNDIRRNNPAMAMLMVTHCKIITCVNRQRRMIKGRMEDCDSVYECHHCMREPDCNLYYLKDDSL